MTEEPPAIHPQAKGAARPKSSGRRPYCAFTRSAEPLARLMLRSRSGELLYSIPYSSIDIIAFTYRTGCGMHLETYRFGFTIRGHDLYPIAEALNARQCALIQEFDAEEFTPPKSLKGRPFVESIRVDIEGKRHPI